MKKVLITQSNYIPWIGYFDAISQVDEFVILDNVQFTKRDWRNRNRIVTPLGVKWLTVPVETKGRFNQLINETQISDPTWVSDHWKTLQLNYKKAPAFSEFGPMIEKIYQESAGLSLSEMNRLFITEICQILEIKTAIRDSSEFSNVEEKSQRLLQISLETNASHYYSGPAAQSYLDISAFKEKGISVSFFEYGPYPTYQQSRQEFDIHVTILDLLFNIGAEAKSFLGVSRLKEGQTK